jgi:hypothetical protein
MDGFGVRGTAHVGPGVFRSIEPAWHDRALGEPDQYGDNSILNELSEDARLIVSEPLGDLHGAWREVAVIHLCRRAERS